MKRWRMLLVPGCVLLVLYIGLFFVLRQRVTVSTGERRPSLVVMYVFANEPAANRLAYYVFYPLLAVHSKSLDSQGEIPEADRKPGTIGPYYIRDVEQLDM